MFHLSQQQNTPFPLSTPRIKIEMLTTVKCKANIFFALSCGLFPAIYLAFPFIPNLLKHKMKLKCMRKSNYQLCKMQWFFEIGINIQTIYTFSKTSQYALPLILLNFEVLKRLQNSLNISNHGGKKKRSRKNVWQTKSRL